MHEMSLMADLMRKIDRLARENDSRITTVRVRLGALSHISASHFREHFKKTARGGPAAAATLIVTESADEHAADAQDIVLESVDVEVDGDG